MRFSLKLTSVVLAALFGSAVMAHIGGAGGEVVTRLDQVSLPATLGLNTQGTALRVDFAPGASALPHSHPGPIFVVVVSGEIETAMEGEPTQRYTAGDTWYEAPNKVHRIARNPSSSMPATLVAWGLSDGKAALVSPVDDQ